MSDDTFSGSFQHLEEGTGLFCLRQIDLEACKASMSIYKGMCSVVSEQFVIPWVVACQAPLSMEFSRQEYWSGLPFSSPGCKG